ncbi:MAG TPA: alkaline phosphatase family protein [Flavisolibacter sp.]|nr:alkaline phosphatase family protein [Flavisolibacter sp.]
MKPVFLFVAVFFFLQSPAQTSRKPIDTSVQTLIVFFDGLRPDYITADLMPQLTAFKAKASYGSNHHSVYPTVTRVNASSYSTGSYPSAHGLMGNTVYFPQVDAKKGINTGEAEEMQKVIEATHGHLLTATTLGEVLQSVGAKMMVFSSGSTGQALMQNHTISGGATINPKMILPASQTQDILNTIGPVPAHAKPNTGQHQWVTDALIQYGLKKDGPLVSAIWFSDPDGAAHSDGIGSPAAVASIRSVDEQFGRILQTLKDRGLDQKFNILISTDHGFVTHIGKESLPDLLIRKGLKKDKESDDVIVVGGALYVKDHNPERIKKIVAALQAEEWIGAIFTRGKKAGDLKGFVEGTLSFESVHWDHQERSADILVDVNWNDEKNGTGYAGSSFSRGVAGHGSLSPYEVHIPLIAFGPGFKRNYESPLPTSNVDLVPTILHLYGIPLPKTMQGRVMTELFAGGKEAPELRPTKEVIRTEARSAEGTYVLTLERTVLGSHRYVDFARVQRTKGMARP